MKVCLLSGLVLQANAFTISEKEASQILSRKPRENPQINENSKFFGLVEGADDLERECIEGRALWVIDYEYCTTGLPTVDSQSGSPWIDFVEPFLERCNDEELDEVYDWETGFVKVNYELV